MTAFEDAAKRNAKLRGRPICRPVGDHFPNHLGLGVFGHGVCLHSLVVGVAGCGGKGNFCLIWALNETSTPTLTNDHIHRGQDQSESGPQLDLASVSRGAGQKMLRNAVPNSPGDRCQGQLGAIFRFILASVHLVMVCVCTLFISEAVGINHLLQR